MARTDIALAIAARAGDGRALDELLRRFDPIVRAVAKNYYLDGYTSDDLEQEGRLALVRAFTREHGWQPGQAPPGPFARMVLARWYAMMLKLAYADRRRANLFPAALDRTIEGIHEDGDITLGDAILQTVPLERTADGARRVREIIAGHGLSRAEHAAIVGIAAGASYAEIGGADETIARKAVDNALQRARRKLAA